jgi:ABC-type nickel/cobalt efflux system permease component RcnA
MGIWLEIAAAALAIAAAAFWFFSSRRRSENTSADREKRAVSVDAGQNSKE